VKCSTARLVLVSSLVVSAAAGSTAFASAPSPQASLVSGCTLMPVGPTGLMVGAGASGIGTSTTTVGVCLQSGWFIDDTHVTVYSGTTKGAVVHDGQGGPDVGAWTGSGQACVQIYWSPNCVPLPSQ
jgi:hypothetical protein